MVSFPETEVQILDYNRVVKDINGLSAPTLLDRIEEFFEVFSSDLPAQPESAGSFGMYLAGGWHFLRFKGDLVSNNTIKDNLDVSILSDKILSPVLGIGDPRTDPRIGFVGGIYPFLSCSFQKAFRGALKTHLDTKAVLEVCLRVGGVHCGVSQTVTCYLAMLARGCQMGLRSKRAR